MYRGVFRQLVPIQDFPKGIIACRRKIAFGGDISLRCYQRLDIRSIAGEARDNDPKLYQIIKEMNESSKIEPSIIERYVLEYRINNAALFAWAIGFVVSPALFISGRRLTRRSQHQK